MFDVLLSGGIVIDGTGGEPFRADVAVAEGRVVEVGDLSGAEAALSLDCRERIVSPGFIDIHSHSDMILALPRPEQTKLMRGRLLQGITTEIVGNCGVGVYPVEESSAASIRALHDFMIPKEARFHWSTCSEYLSFLEKNGVPVNVGALVPHNPLRITVAGPTGNALSPEKMSEMRSRLDAELKEGALGLSFGLIYFPGRFSRPEELIALAETVGRNGGVVTFHQRSGSAEVVFESVDEVIRVGAESGARVQLSHDHVQGKKAWPLVEEILRREKKARESGVLFGSDVIPYTGVTTTMLAIYPPWALAEGVEGFLRLASLETERRRMKADMENVSPRWPPWEEGVWATNIVRDCGWDGVYVGYVGSGKNKWCEGLSAVELARKKGTDPFEGITDLLLEEGGEVGLRLIGISGDLENEEPLRAFMTDPDHAFVSDAWDVGRGKPHPGVYGAFPRCLGRYVREKRWLSLPEAVRRITSLPASLFSLAGRGVLKKGAWAAIVVFDSARISERGTYDDPRVAPEGIDYVLVNGKPVVSQGELQEGVCAGKVIRGGGR